MARVEGKKAHVLAVPFPAQGHVKPLMKLCRQIAKRGIKVTFVNIESVHEKVVASAKLPGENQEEEDSKIVLTSIPDGGSPGDDQNDTFKLLDSLRSTMPGFLADLIGRINSSSNGDEKITCVMTDITVGWILETAQNMGAEPVIFSPPSAASMAMALHSSKLLEEGNLDPNGCLKGGETISLSADIPPWTKNELPWSAPIDLTTQKIFFECSLRVAKTIKEAGWLLCNACYELESPAFELIPKLRPIGPLLEPNSPKSSCNFHHEDESCLSWLDGKPVGSVVYVSFGSLAVLSQQQLDELALGLELSDRAFLWVARPDLANGSRVVYPDGFPDRVRELGKIVEWAPQEKVLSHPSVACFLSHCGWNSTLEGLGMGVPFLCWPYFSDQFHNQNYICDKWEIGLRINPDENGIRSRHEIKQKIDMLFSDSKLKENALKLKEMCAKSVSEGGSSYYNFETFIDHLRKLT